MSDAYHNEILKFISMTIDNISNALLKEPYMKDDMTQQTKIKQMRESMNRWIYIRSCLIKTEVDISENDIEKVANAMAEYELKNTRLARKIVDLQKEISDLKGTENDRTETDPEETAKLV
jgi:hypothetical protein